MSNNHLTSYYKLPFPIRQYNIFEREQYEFDDYKKLITNNLKFSTKTVVNKTETINNYYEKYCNKNSRIIRLIIEYLLDNISKVKIMNSLDSVAFGIGISERFSTIEFIYPTCIHFDDTNLYTNYNEDEFYNMRVFEKLEWLKENCEFIPVCILKEDFNIIDNYKDATNMLRQYRDSICFINVDAQLSIAAWFNFIKSFVEDGLYQDN